MESGGTRMIESVPILIGSIILCNLAGFMGMLVTSTGPGSWYDMLVKPSFNPPSWIFGPVWTLLYILMGISLYLVLMAWRKGTDTRIPLLVFGIQLVLNALWSFLFFGLRSPAAGLAGILVLWVFIVATIVTFSRVSRPAALLLLPYLAWVSFASILNYAILTLNP
ncbi:MAG: tryptophan-rich sensory protein [Methanomicrobiales archaeon]|nr:tryptophan-rich sensory protein [Methanomicrobiales archaeon]